MSRPSLHPLSWAITLVMALPVHSTTRPANASLCRVPETLGPFRTTPPTAGREARASSPIVIDADTLDVSSDEVTTFSGRVELIRADQWMATDTLIYQHAQGTWQSPGPLRFEDEGLRLRAANAEGNTGEERVKLSEVEYHFTDGTLGNGTAQTAVREGTRGTLTDAEFSTCPPGQRQWAFRATTIEIEDEIDRGVARNATLRIGEVPVLWLPWVSFPTSDARRSGLLVPRIGFDDENGFDYEQPIYLNLAPNYDATLSPRWMSRRGLKLSGEVRYLLTRSHGRVDAHWLADDELRGRDRHKLLWQDFTAISPNWWTTVNLQEISDRDYLRDFGGDFGYTLALLDSHLALNGRGRHWNTRLSVERWEAASPAVLPGSEPFARLPRLRGQWLQPLAPWLDAGIDFETVRFTHDHLTGGRRIDLRPNLRLYFGGASWFVNPELAWRYTAYDIEPEPTTPDRDRSPSRHLPIGSLDMGLLFEREARLFGSDYLQTLEPRLFYLRVPFRDQDALPLFDTQPLSFSWPGLFRSNRYTGADRQGDANQITVAVTSRLLDSDNGRERLSASLGRIHFFDPPRVNLPGERGAASDRSAYVGEVDWRISDDWSLSLAQQWHSGVFGTELSALRSQWRFAERAVVNASYRYRKDLLEQTDLSFAVPINPHWRAVGRWAWSVRDRRTLEALGGVEWRGCCMAVRLLARDHLRELNAERNTGIYLELELNGIGNFGRDSERLLSDTILGYSP